MLPVVSPPDLDFCAGAYPNTTTINDATRYLSGLLLSGLGGWVRSNRPGGGGVPGMGTGLEVEVLYGASW